MTPTWARNRKKTCHNKGRCGLIDPVRIFNSRNNYVLRTKQRTFKTGVPRCSKDYEIAIKPIMPTQSTPQSHGNKVSKSMNNEQNNYRRDALLIGLGNLHKKNSVSPKKF